MSEQLSPPGEFATKQPEYSLASRAARAPLPRIGFLGLGWIGRHRMQSLLTAQACQVAAVADTDGQACDGARLLAPDAAAVRTLEDLLALDLDAIVIATPSALHAAQARQALERGLAVFCQKPLARTAREAAAIIAAARRSDRLLGCDLSYRHTEGMRRIRELVASGELGHVFAADLLFHNAYGPDKAWFRDPVLSGGGCMIDLGTHLVDLALWTLGFPRVEQVSIRLYAQGRLLPAGASEVEDFAAAQLDLAGGTVVRIGCSWNLSAGCDAVIEARFHGTRGAACLRNVNGSFYDFVAERFDGTRRTTLVEPPDEWGGRAIVDWARQLASDGSYDPQIESTVEVAAALDAMYGR
jgi:predicted dehydrogenase